MIVKVQHFEDFKINNGDAIFYPLEEIYSNVESISKYKDETEREYLDLKIKGQEHQEIIPITTTDKNGNHPSLVSAVWLMSNEGKTIERLY